jgi:hypothetical protein
VKNKFKVGDRVVSDEDFSHGIITGLFGHYENIFWVKFDSGKTNFYHYSNLCPEVKKQKGNKNTDIFK